MGKENCRSLAFAPNDKGGSGPRVSAAPTALRSCSELSPSPSGLGSRLAAGPPPDFLWDLVAPVSFMRLSSWKGAHAVLSSAAWQEIRVRASHPWRFCAVIPPLTCHRKSAPRDDKGEGSAHLSSRYRRMDRAAADYPQPKTLYCATLKVMVMPGSTRWPARGLWLKTVPAGSTVSAGAICEAAAAVSVAAGSLE